MRKDMERKELEYYLRLHYPVVVHPDPEGGFVGEIEELHGCMTQAETIDELFQAIEDARRLWIKTAYEDGQDIPLPRDMEEYTGKFLVRIPKNLHRDLVRTAKRQGVSLNQYVTGLLASGVSRDMMTQAAAVTSLILGPWGSKDRVLEFDQVLVLAGQQSEQKGN